MIMNKKIICTKLNFILILFSFCYLTEFKSQLRGPGIEINSLININSSPVKSYGLDITYETAGMYFNIKNLIGYQYQSAIISNGLEDFTTNSSKIRHQIQGKYWFGNLIRASKMHRVRCANEIKIREDYHFKPYLLIGLDNSVRIGENVNKIHNIKAVTGIGSNIKKFGNIHSAQLLFIEIRQNFNLNKFNDDIFENKFSIEASVGLKFY